VTASGYLIRAILYISGREYLLFYDIGNFSCSCNKSAICGEYDRFVRGEFLFTCCTIGSYNKQKGEYIYEGKMEQVQSCTDGSRACDLYDGRVGGRDRLV
jgi:hypothetical protein